MFLSPPLALKNKHCITQTVWQKKITSKGLSGLLGRRKGKQKAKEEKHRGLANDSNLKLRCSVMLMHISHVRHLYAAVSPSYIWPTSKNLFNSQIISLDLELDQATSAGDKDLLSAKARCCICTVHFHPNRPPQLHFPSGACAFRPTCSSFATGLHQPSPIVLGVKAGAAKQKWLPAAGASPTALPLPDSSPNLRDGSHGLEREAEVLCCISKQKATLPFFCQ